MSAVTAFRLPIVQGTLNDRAAPALLASLATQPLLCRPSRRVAIQEAERWNVLLGEMRRSLAELDLGLKGDLTITPALVRSSRADTLGGTAASPMASAGVGAPGAINTSLFCRPDSLGLTLPARRSG